MKIDQWNSNENESNEINSSVFLYSAYLMEKFVSNELHQVKGWFGFDQVGFHATLAAKGQSMLSSQ